MHFIHKPIYFLFLFISFYSFAQEPTTDNLASKEFTIPPFNALRIYTGLDVKLIPSNENKAVVYGDNIHDIVLASKKGTLRVKLKAESVFNLGFTHVELYYTESLDLIDVNQGSKLISSATLEQTFLEIRVNEESTMTAPVALSRLQSTVSTGSKLYLEGSSSISEININTGGSCEAENMVTTQTKINVTAGGRAYVNATEIIDAKVTAGGLIRIYGDPEKRITKKVVSGKIVFME